MTLGLTQKIPFRSDGVFDLDSSILDEATRAAALDCIARQKVAARTAKGAFRPDIDAANECVSEPALARILGAGEDVHGIATDRSISNVVSFRFTDKQDAIADGAVEESRRKVDALVANLIRRLFDGGDALDVVSSGHFWYPPGSYMGWHTNSKVPGWRIYINYAETEGDSFFRYRDPANGEIVTLLDKHWNLRLFRITRDNPVWHTVYSNTNRFSLGYMVKKRPPTNAVGKIIRKARRLVST